MFSRVAVQAARSQGLTLGLGVEGEGRSQKTVKGPRIGQLAKNQQESTL